MSEPNAAGEEAPARPLRYLPAAELDKCLPDVEGRVALCAQALLALARDEAEMPPKIGVHPRPGALLHAMPAWLRGPDLVGLKWVAAYPDNRRLGLPAINGLVILNDARSGLPIWIMDAARITAVRTASVSGVAIRLLGAPVTDRVAILGAGVQARSHLEVVAALLPDATIALFDRHPERAAAAAAEQNEMQGRQSVVPAATAQAAVDGAQIVITVATLGATADTLRGEWLAPRTLLVAVDFATYVDSALAGSAREFVVDDRAQFNQYRDAGHFPGYPDATATMGELLNQREIAPDGTAGRRSDESDERPVLVTHLGVGLADVLFADAIRQEAERQGAGIELPR